MRLENFLSNIDEFEEEQVQNSSNHINLLQTPSKTSKNFRN